MAQKLVTTFVLLLFLLLFIAGLSMMSASFVDTQAHINQGFLLIFAIPFSLKRFIDKQ